MAAEQVQASPETRRMDAAVRQMRAGVQAMSALIRQNDIETLGVALIQIRESGIDPLEAVFAEGVRLLDKSGEYHAAGALAEANRAYQRRYLHLGEPQDGLVRLDGLLDTEGGATLRTALQAFMKPIKDDARSYGQRCADAVVELARQGSGAKRDGAGPRPQLIIRASLDTLAGTLGAPAGELEGGGTVPAETVQRYACDSAI